MKVSVTKAISKRSALKYFLWACCFVFSLESLAGQQGYRFFPPYSQAHDPNRPTGVGVIPAPGAYSEEDKYISDYNKSIMHRANMSELQDAASTKDFEEQKLKYVDALTSIPLRLINENLEENTIYIEFTIKQTVFGVARGLINFLKIENSQNYLSRFKDKALGVHLEEKGFNLNSFAAKMVNFVNTFKSRSNVTKQTPISIRFVAREPRTPQSYDPVQAARGPKAGPARLPHPGQAVGGRRTTGEPSPPTLVPPALEQDRSAGREGRSYLPYSGP